MKKKIIIIIITIVLLVSLISIGIIFNKNNNNIISLEDYIEKEILCDKDIFIKDNKAYVHCIGRKGNIIEFTQTKSSINKRIIEFDYSKTPNISQLHITIDGIDEKYIYLKSAVKLNDSLKEGEYVKCSLSTNICEYYSGNSISKIIITKNEKASNKFHKYLEREDKVIYISDSIKNIYVETNNKQIQLKDYISKSYQTMDDSINNITSPLYLDKNIREGEISVYKSEEYDITLIKCNTQKGNKNIYIGDYKLEYNNKTMCK